MTRFNYLLVWLLLALTASLLYCRVFINSDTLFLESLSTDLFLHGGQWTDWRITPAPAYLPDMLLYFMAFPFLSSPICRIFFVSAIQVFLLATTTLWLAKTIRPQLKLHTKTSLLLLLAFVTFCAEHSGMWLYFYSTNNHFAALFFALIAVGVSIHFFEKPTPGLAFLFILIGGVAKASTAISLISFIAPAGVFFLMLLFKKSTLYKPRILAMLLMLVASFLLSIAIDKLLTYNNPLEGRISVTLKATQYSCTVLWQATKAVFSFQHPWTGILGVIVVLAFVHVLSQLFQRKDWKISCCTWFLVTVIPINFFGVILSGGLRDVYGYRYFAFPIALTLLLSILYLDQLDLKKTNFWRALQLSLIVLLFGGCGLYLKHARHTPSFLNDRKATESHDSAMCLSMIEAQGFPLKAGVADYWNATATTYYLTKKHRILATLSDLTPLFWMSTLQPLLYPERYPEYDYNFVILLNVEDNQFEYTPEKVGLHLPPPTTRYRCPTGDMEVWLYQDDALDKVMQKKLNQFKETFNGHFFMTGSQLPGLIGKQVRNTRVADARYDEPGVLSYGPYVSLSPGEYEIILKYSSEHASKPIVGYVKMGEFVGRETLMHQENLYATSHGKISHTLKLPFRTIERFEVQTWFSGDGELKIYSLEIIKGTH